MIKRYKAERFQARRYEANAKVARDYGRTGAEALHLAQARRHAQAAGRALAAGVLALGVAVAVAVHFAT